MGSVTRCSHGVGVFLCAHNVGYVITGSRACLLVGREVATCNWGCAEARGGTYMYTWKLVFSLFCCVVVWVGHGVWWVTTLGGVKRLAGEEAGDNQLPSHRL